MSDPQDNGSSGESGESAPASSLLPPADWSLKRHFNARRFTLWLTVIVEGGLAVVAMLLGWLIGTWPFARFAWSGSDVVVGFLAALPMFALFLASVRWPIGPLKRIAELFDQTIRPLFEDCTLADLALISLLAGLGEEMFFRGVVQAALEPLMGMVLALVTASVLFGLAHLITPTYAVLAGGIGLYLGWLWLWTDNLLAPIVAHAVYDFLALAFLLRLRAATVGEVESDNPSEQNPIAESSASRLEAARTMKAAYIEETGPADNIKFGERPKPTAGKAQVLVKVGAVAVNPIDTYIRAGAVAMQIPKPFIVGCDLAGSVEAVGPEAKRFKVGDRVWGSNQGLFGRQGTFAEYAAVDECWLYPTPERIEDATAAAIALVGITAHLGLIQRARLKAGESIFINGGSGGVGATVLQMAKAVGARVIVSAGSDDKLNRCKELGADAAVNYKTDNVDNGIREFAPTGVDVWWETTRTPDFERAVPLLAKRGRFVLMAGRDAKPTFPVGPFYVKDCSLHGFAMFNASPDEQRQAADDINRWLTNGVLRANIDRVLPLTDAALAHKLQEESTVGLSGKLTGKLVLTPSLHTV